MNPSKIAMVPKNFLNNDRTELPQFMQIFRVPIKWKKEVNRLEAVLDRKLN